MNNNTPKTKGSLGNRDERVLLRLRLLRLFPLKVVSFSKKRRRRRMMLTMMMKSSSSKNL